MFRKKLGPKHGERLGKDPPLHPHRVRLRDVLVRGPRGHPPARHGPVEVHARPQEL